ncbi:MAG: lytic transglycosylase domain-containing protein [Limnobacter sp.]|nr:lytic transglycosylase domain-containing protein [Limnobacter sp.]
MAGASLLSLANLAHALPAYEPMADNVLLALRRSISEQARPDPVFESALHRIDWLSVMSKRLARRVPSPEARLNLIKLIRYEAQRAGLDPQLVFSVIEVESNFNPKAVSPVGALGLMQIMPFWTEVLSTGEKEMLFEPQINVRYGCLILAHYLDIEKGNVERALARYNGSLGRTVYSDKVLDRLRRNWNYNW